MDRIITLLSPRKPASLPCIETMRATKDLRRAIKHADAVADHAMITADMHKRRAAALTAYAEEVAKHMREVWGPE